MFEVLSLSLKMTDSNDGCFNQYDNNNDEDEDHSNPDFRCANHIRGCENSFTDRCAEHPRMMNYEGTQKSRD